MSIDQEILKTDSIIINGLGYKTIKLPISKLNNEPIKIYQEIVTLPEVTVKSLFNWDNFAKKIKLSFATSPFESDFQKSITIKKNTSQLKLSLVKMGKDHGKNICCYRSSLWNWRSNKSNAQGSWQ
jgi:hypothetical protein